MVRSSYNSGNQCFTEPECQQVQLVGKETNLPTRNLCRNAQQFCSNNARTGPCLSRRVLRVSQHYELKVFGDFQECDVVMQQQCRTVATQQCSDISNGCGVAFNTK